MANITKTQVKKRAIEICRKLEELYEKYDDLNSELEDIKSELEDLQCETDDEANSIEPYDGKDDLTQAQEDRLEWLAEFASIMEDTIGNMDNFIENVEDVPDLSDIYMYLD